MLYIFRAQNDPPNLEESGTEELWHRKCMQKIQAYRLVRDHALEQRKQQRRNRKEMMRRQMDAYEKMKVGVGKALLVWAETESGSSAVSGQTSDSSLPILSPGSCVTGGGEIFWSYEETQWGGGHRQGDRNRGSGGRPECREGKGTPHTCHRPAARETRQEQEEMKPNGSNLRGFIHPISAWKLCTKLWFQRPLVDTYPPHLSICYSFITRVVAFFTFSSVHTCKKPFLSINSLWTRCLQLIYLIFQWPAPGCKGRGCRSCVKTDCKALQGKHWFWTG